MAIISGYATRAGLYGRQGGELVKLPVTRTPIVALVPCRWCGAVGGCDCLDWMEFMLLDTPTHLEEATNE